MNHSPRHRHSLFAATFFLLSCMVIQLAGYRWLAALGGPAATGGPGSMGAAAYRGHVMEWIGLCLIAVWTTGRRRRIPGYLFCGGFLVFASAQSVQFLSYYFTRQFLTSDGLQNAVHIGLLVSPFSIFVAALPVLLTVILGFLLRRYRGSPPPVRTRWLLTGGMALALLLTVVASPREGSVGAWLRSPAPGGFPATRLGELLVRKDRVAPVPLSAADIQFARDFGFVFEPDAEFPFINDELYGETVAFPQTRKIGRPNLIVFFVESLSARKLGVYGSQFPDVTPEIDAFSRRAMVVDNYYSHTAATYRGLRGQLCSMYPFFGGVSGWFDPDFDPPETRLYGLPAMLERLGYDTVLLGANTARKARMDVQATAVGFTRSLLRDQIRNELLDGEELSGPYLSDHQMMRALWAAIEGGRLEEPFFAFIYNVGTHTNLDSKNDGVDYGDGANRVLNTTHTFDHSFGEFWRRFRSSSLAETTIVVLTADHPHFPTPAFIAIAGPDFQKVFFDRIPLIIYHPGLDLPQRFDGGITTSLDFAPSIAHLMGVPNQRNHFLGRSIFEPEDPKRRRPTVGQYGETLCVIRADGRIFVYSIAAKLPPRIASLARFIEYSQHIELSDRMWDGNTSRNDGR